METLQQVVNDLSRVNGQFIEAGRRLLSTCEHRVLFPCDEFMLSMLNRASWQQYGLIPLLSQKNYIVAAALVRLQLDNVLRFSGVIRHSDPHGVARQIAAGKELRKIKGSDGQLMTDAHLQSQMDDPWFSQVYKRTSGYVHLSDQHFFHFSQMAVHTEGGPSQFFLGPPREYVPPAAIHEVAVVFREIGEKTVHFAEEWISGRGIHGTHKQLEERFPRHS